MMRATLAVVAMCVTDVWSTATRRATTTSTARGSTDHRAGAMRVEALIYMVFAISTSIFQFFWEMTNLY